MGISLDIKTDSLRTKAGDLSLLTIAIPLGTTSDMTAVGRRYQALQQRLSTIVQYANSELAKVSAKLPVVFGGFGKSSGSDCVRLDTGDCQAVDPQNETDLLFFPGKWSSSTPDTLLKLSDGSVFTQLSIWAVGTGQRTQNVAPALIPVLQGIGVFLGKALVALGVASAVIYLAFKYLGPLVRQFLWKSGMYNCRVVDLKTGECKKLGAPNASAFLIPLAIAAIFLFAGSRK